MQFAQVKVRHSGVGYIFGDSGNARKAAEAIRSSVSHAVGEKVLPPENISVEFAKFGELDLPTADLEITVVTPVTYGEEAREFADRWAKTTAVYFYARIETIWKRRAKVAFIYKIPRALVYHSLD